MIKAFLTKIELATQLELLEQKLKVMKERQETLETVCRNYNDNFTAILGWMKEQTSINRELWTEVFVFRKFIDHIGIQVIHGEDGSITFVSNGKVIKVGQNGVLEYLN